MQPKAACLLSAHDLLLPPGIKGLKKFRVTLLFKQKLFDCRGVQTLLKFIEVTYE